LPTRIIERISKLSKPPRSKRPRPNRIFELTKERKWKYADVAEKVRSLAKARKDTAHAKAHTITINRLATGDINLTQDWMNILGEVFSVPASDIISPPVAQNLKRVTVSCALQSNHWRSDSDLPPSEQYEIMIPQNAALDGASIYAGVIKGLDNNLRYPPGAIVIVSKLEQKPDEIVEGRRYHVRVMRGDGMIEDSIKRLVRGPEGHYWLKPESDHPAHQEWLALDGSSGIKIEIVGRVRGVYHSED
jgi:hypothetical protein